MTIEALRQSMTPGEAAARLGIDRRTLMRFIHSGELVAVNMGGQSVPKYRISEESVERFLIGRTTAPQAAAKKKS